MGFFTLTPKRRLMVTIVLSFSFFVAEIVVAFMTKSLALLADAFHYMNDLIGFIVALVAIVISERSDFPQDLSFGWQRARLLGAFFNGVFLLALGVSILLQSIERFITLQKVENPKLVLIMGCIGFGLNVISAVFLHEHDHGDGSGHSHSHAPNEESEHGHAHVDDDDQLHTSHAEHRHLNVQTKGSGRDLNMLGAMIHVLGDAINNVGVIIAAVIIWKTHYPGRYYADPGVSMAIAIMILLSSIPLVKNSGTILLESAPRGVDIKDVKHDLEKIPGIESVHELHIWRLDQKKAIASAHVVVSDQTVSSFMEKARTVSECLHAYGVHSATLQPELSYSSQVSLVGEGYDGVGAVAATGAVDAHPTGPSDNVNADLTLSKIAVVSSRGDKAEGNVAGPAAEGSNSIHGDGFEADSDNTNDNNNASTSSDAARRRPSTAVSVIRRRRAEAGGCQIPCGTLCENLMCCTSFFYDFSCGRAMYYFVADLGYTESLAAYAGHRSRLDNIVILHNSIPNSAIEALRSREECGYHELLSHTRNWAEIVRRSHRGKHDNVSPCLHKHSKATLIEGHISALARLDYEKMADDTNVIDENALKDTMGNPFVQYVF